MDTFSLWLEQRDHELYAEIFGIDWDKAKRFGQVAATAGSLALQGVGLSDPKVVDDPNAIQTKYISKTSQDERDRKRDFFNMDRMRSSAQERRALAGISKPAETPQSSNRPYLPDGSSYRFTMKNMKKMSKDKKSNKRKF
jgi:hypothetical protein